MIKVSTAFICGVLPSALLFRHYAFVHAFINGPTKVFGEDYKASGLVIPITENDSHAPYFIGAISSQFVVDTVNSNFIGAASPSAAASEASAIVQAVSVCTFTRVPFCSNNADALTIGYVIHDFGHWCSPRHIPIIARWISHIAHVLTKQCVQ